MLEGREKLWSCVFTFIIVLLNLGGNKKIIMKKRILVITSGYPIESAIQRYAFVDNLVCAMNDHFADCVVLYPISVTHALLHKEKLPSRNWVRVTQNGSEFIVYCPRIITLSNSKIKYIRLLCNRFNQKVFSHAVLHTIRKNNLNFDIVYGHFLSPSGITATEMGERYGATSCMAYGENSPYTIENVGEDYARKKLEKLNSVVSVSTENAKYLNKHRIVDAGKIKVFPNSVDTTVFYPRDKVQARRKLGMPENAFIVSFLGYFTETKGSERLSEAISKLKDVYSIFIGSGNKIPTCENILFMSQLPHEVIPEYLAASDVFVLPTLAEGCCNAIVEALACGLPVISSNLPFNDDILDSECSIRIDTSNVEEIADAIRRLQEDPNRVEKMHEAAIRKSKEFNIVNRAENILKWIEKCGEQV